MKIKIGLSLCGGGALGVAHIGVLRAFEEANIEIHAMAGASAGSLVSALYNGGASISDMLTILEESSVFSILRLAWPMVGLAKLTYLRKILDEHLEQDDFSVMKRPTFVVAANMNTGEAQSFSTGSVIDAVVASCSIPLIFEPATIDGQMYFDGGVLDNLPVADLVPVSDYIIGVNVIPRTTMTTEELNSAFGVGSRTFTLSMLANMEPSLSTCDLVITPEGIEKYNPMQLNKYEELYELGYLAGKEAVPTILAAIQDFEDNC